MGGKKTSVPLHLFLWQFVYLHFWGTNSGPDFVTPIHSEEHLTAWLVPRGYTEAIWIMLKSSFHCEWFIFLSGLKMASAELFIDEGSVLHHGGICNLCKGRNISAKGPPLMERTDATAVSLECLHEAGSEIGKAHQRYADAAHRHLTSKYRHTQHRVNLCRTDKTYILGNEDLALCSWHQTTYSVAPAWKLHFWKLQTSQLYLTCIECTC